MRAVARLKLHLDRVLGIAPGPQLTAADCVYIFAKARQIIEEGNLQGQFPNLQFFCNWVLHTSLSLSQAINKKFVILSEIFASAKPGDRTVNDRVNDFISFRELRKELIDLFSRYTLSDVLFREREVWYEFLVLLAPELVDKPLQFQRPSSKKAIAGYEKAYQKMIGTGVVVKSLRLVGVHGQSIRWIVEIERDGVRIDCEGTIARTEEDFEFDPPKYLLRT